MPTRVNITLSDENYAELRESAKRSGKDMSEFVRNALRVYQHILEEKRAGAHIYTGKGNNVEKELLIP